MLTSAQLDDANAYGEWMRVMVHERILPMGDRTRAAGGCLGICQDHHHAIVVLLEAGIYASCFALLRVAFEAYIRGEWLAQCATDAQVGKFLRGEEPPPISTLLSALETKAGFKSGLLTEIKKEHWGHLCGYTHTGGIHVQRWNTGDGIEANYSVDEILEVLRFADIVVALAVLGVLRLASDTDASLKVLTRLKERADI
jgi:hypothetical protein